jgi:acyl-CoA thioester hydrolase
LSRACAEWTLAIPHDCCNVIRSSAAPVKNPPRNSSFRFRHTVEVRFRDLDVMGHVHHTLPLIYLEEARAAYWREIAGRTRPTEIDYVLAEITCRFHKRIHWPGHLEVGLRVSSIGSKSFHMEFEIRDGAGDVVASGSTVQVAYDYAAARSMMFDAETRRRIEAFEGQAE